MLDDATIEAAAQIAGDHEISAIEITEAERAAGALEEGKLALALERFQTHVYLRIEKLFSADYVRSLDAHYRKAYGRYLGGTNKPDRRPLFTLDIKGAVNDPRFLDNPLISPLLGRLLGQRYIAAAVSSVVSYPGAPDQFLHRDARQLFPGSEEGVEENGIDKDLPTYSITMLAPLVDFTRETGCTRVWPGSHRIAGKIEGLRVGSIDPEIAVGSVLLTDGRVLHRGAANHSDRLRPLMYVTYQRMWYRDLNGYERRPPVLVSRPRPQIDGAGAAPALRVDARDEHEALCEVLHRPRAAHAPAPEADSGHLGPLAGDWDRASADARTPGRANAWTAPPRRRRRALSGAAAASARSGARELRVQQRRGKVLIADRPQPARDRQTPDRSRPNIGARRVRSAMHHRRADLDAGRESVGQQEPAGFLLEDRPKAPRDTSSSASSRCKRGGQLPLDSLGERAASDPDRGSQR